MRLCVCVTSKYLAVDYDGFSVCVCGNDVRMGSI